MKVIGDHKPRNLQYTLLLSREDVDILDDYQHGGTIVGLDGVRNATFYLTDSFVPQASPGEFRYNHVMGGYVHHFSFSEVTTRESLENKLHGLELPLTMDGASQDTLKLGTVRVELDYLKKPEPSS
jgi:hypothetical protein